MNLTEHDAYALRRAVAMMDVPPGLTLSPLVEALLASLNWKYDRAHWSILQQILSRDTTISAQVLRVDPNKPLPTVIKANDDTYVPPLAHSAQLSDKLLASAWATAAFTKPCSTSSSAPATAPAACLSARCSVASLTRCPNQSCVSSAIRRSGSSW